MLRRAVAADYAGMHRVRVAVKENRLSSPDRITQADYIDAMEASGRSWIIESDGEIIAFASAMHTGNVWALFVHPDHAGRGHGKALHNIMIAWCRSRGLSRLWLSTAPDTRAERFYIAQGWRRSGTMEGEDIRLERDVS
jgi:GNAT superfamily N-acetyltransferase